MARKMMKHPEGGLCCMSNREREKAFLLAESITAGLDGPEAVVVRKRDPETGGWILAFYLAVKGRDINEDDILKACGIFEKLR